MVAVRGERDGRNRTTVSCWAEHIEGNKNKIQRKRITFLNPAIERKFGMELLQERNDFPKLLVVVESDDDLSLAFSVTVYLNLRSKLFGKMVFDRSI